MIIQTMVFKYWVDCEHKSWKEIIKDGWKFEGLNNKNNVIMTKNGFINEFRNKPKEVLK